MNNNKPSFNNLVDKSQAKYEFIAYRVYSLTSDLPIEKRLNTMKEIMDKLLDCQMVDNQDFKNLF